MSDYFFRGIILRQKGGNTLNYHNKRKKDKKKFWKNKLLHKWKQNEHIFIQNTKWAAWLACYNYVIPWIWIIYSVSLSFSFSQIQVLSLIWNQAVSLHNIPVLHHWFKYQLIAESIYKPYIIKSYGKLANWDVRKEREKERGIWCIKPLSFF